MSRYNRDQCILSWSKNLKEESGIKPEIFIKIMHQLLSEEYTKGYADGIENFNAKYAEALMRIAKLKGKLKAKKGGAA